MRYLLWLSLLLLLLLSSSSVPYSPDAPILFAERPPQATIRMLEVRLSREPCVGALDRWSRRYSYWTTEDRRLDKQSVVIKLAEAGHNGRPAGAWSEPIRAVIEIDDSMFKTAFGIYDQRRAVIRFWHCGPNFGNFEPRRELKM